MNSDQTVPEIALPQVALSTTSVFPESTAAGFEVAARVGYDGVELMVGLDSTSSKIDVVKTLSADYGMPVLAVHAPVLLVMQRVWGSDPWDKLRRSAEAAHELGASTVVVHPPFRWQGTYAGAFVDGIRELNETTGITFCVENMYPWRVPRRSNEFKAYLPGWDPSELDYDHLCLDLSHASTAQQSSLELARSWGAKLQHIHLTDGRGSFKDEHLLPGHGDQQADELLQYATASGFSGHVVLEVSTRGNSRPAKELLLREALEFTRANLAAGLPSDQPAAAGE